MIITILGHYPLIVFMMVNIVRDRVTHIFNNIINKLYRWHNNCFNHGKQ
jgi:hypothetical protein